MGSCAIPAVRFDPEVVEAGRDVREGPSAPPQRRFQISYLPNGVARWANFGKPINAWTPREAIEKCRPQAFGRYRVACLEGGEPISMFQVSRGKKGCAISELDSAPLAGSRS